MRQARWLLIALTLMLVTALPVAAKDKPNILVIFGDDVGMWNISAYHDGMMAGSTPNIDRIGAEGARFTDYYAQASCSRTTATPRGSSARTTWEIWTSSFRPTTASTSSSEIFTTSTPRRSRKTPTTRRTPRSTRSTDLAE